MILEPLVLFYASVLSIETFIRFRYALLVLYLLILEPLVLFYASVLSIETFMRLYFCTVKSKKKLLYCCTSKASKMLYLCFTYALLLDSSSIPFNQELFHFVYLYFCSTFVVLLYQ
jgi:hypothetical protein